MTYTHTLQLCDYEICQLFHVLCKLKVFFFWQTRITLQQCQDKFLQLIMHKHNSKQRNT